MKANSNLILTVECTHPLVFGKKTVSIHSVGPEMVTGYIEDSTMRVRLGTFEMSAQTQGSLRKYHDHNPVPMLLGAELPLIEELEEKSREEVKSFLSDLFETLNDLRKHIKESFFEKESEMVTSKTPSLEKVEDTIDQDSLLGKLSYLEAYTKRLEERLNEMESKAPDDSQTKEKTFKIDSFQVGWSPVVVTFNQVPGQGTTWRTDVGSLTVNNGEGAVVIIPTTESDWVLEYDEINRVGTLNGELMTKLNSQTFPVYN